jgi:hypothetical protein
VAIAMLQALVEGFGTSADGTSPPRRSRGRTPLPVVLVVLWAFAAGAWFVTIGVRTAVGYVTGNEPGEEHLLRAVANTEQGLTLRVVSVKLTDHFTRVEVASRNGTGNTITLPLFKNCVFQGRDGTTLEAESFKSRWNDYLAPGSFQRGTITFNGHLPRSVRRATLSFATVFKQGFDGPDSIQVPGIRITKNPRTTTE